MPNHTPDLSAAVWRKSSYSGSAQADSCVEVADGYPGIIPVRDSKDPQGPALTFTPTAWTTFITAIHDGEFPA